MRIALLFPLAVLAGCEPFHPGGEPRSARPFEAADLDPSALRFVTWNINTVGFPGETQYAAMLDVIGRLQPDVLALNEIEDDEDAFITEAFAAEAGFDYVVIGDHVGFGDDRNAILSRYPITPFGVSLSDDPGEEHFMGYDSPSLSGDPDALDISRAIVAARVETPSASIGVLSLHWKSGGTGNATEFRRAVETVRTLQALDAFTEVDHLIVSGDLNVSVYDNAPTPEAFYAIPDGFPSRFHLGPDIAAMLATPEGLRNHPHAALEDHGLVRLEAEQLDGSVATRPSSGRTIDYIYANPGLQAVGSEIYNAALDDAGAGLPKAGEPLDPYACEQTSDHLPVVVDFDLGEDTSSPTVLEVGDLVAGDLVIAEIFPDPDDCPDSAGEWIEIANRSGFAVQLEGLEVVDLSGNRGALGPIRVDVGGRVVVARSPGACGVPVDGSYGAETSLNNSGDTLYLEAQGLVIDALTYEGSEPGASWRLDDEGRWCSGAPTPGAPNPACPVTHPGVRTVDELEAGDLRITELFANPDACPDSEGEWVEIANVTSDPIQLEGVELVDATGNVGVLGAFVLQPGSRAVVARSASPCGATADGVYGSVTLNNGGDTITLFAGDTVLSTVSYGSEGGQAGLAWSRDDSGDWCAVWPTPGSPNPACP